MSQFALPPQVWPHHHSPVFFTKNGTPYLKGPGAAIIGQTHTNLEGARDFLKDFGFEAYLEDPDKLTSGEALVKFAGQLCYMALGIGRSFNAAASKYLEHIKQSGHGSVTEHVSASLLFYGLSRSQTHELVRHRAGFAYSQLSQRYVDGKLVRFLERPEYQNHPELHRLFEERIDRDATEYEKIASILLEVQKSGDEIMTADRKTDMRKKVNQAARSVLPNETEAPIVVTANVRAWRHFFEMRAAEGAEIEIRSLAFLTFTMLKEIWPILLEDYEAIRLSDGTDAVKTKNRKI